MATKRGTLRPRKEVLVATDEVSSSIRGRKRQEKNWVSQSDDHARFKAYKRERNRVCAKNCRERKNLRYQYLSEHVDFVEEKVCMLQKELENLHMWARQLDEGVLSPDLVQYRQSVENSRLLTS